MPEHTQAKGQSSKAAGTVRPASAVQVIEGEEAVLQQGTINRVLANPTTLSTTDVMYLQRSIGNRAVSQLLGRDRTDKPASPNNASGLRVGPADDVYEREARQVANQVTRSTAIQRSTTSQSAPEIGREGGAVSGELANQIRRAKHGGSPISNQIRRKVEKQTGDNYKDVRVHQGKSSQSINDSIGARAATLGNEIFLGRDQSPHDIQLMAHELTHVTQQRGQRSVSALSTAMPTIQRGLLDEKKPARLRDKEYPVIEGELNTHPLPYVPSRPSYAGKMKDDPRYGSDRAYTGFVLDQKARHFRGEEETDPRYFDHFPEHRPPVRQFDNDPARYYAEASKHLQNMLPQKEEYPGDDFLETNNQHLHNDLGKHIFLGQSTVSNAVKPDSSGRVPRNLEGNPVNIVSRLLPPMHDNYIEADKNLQKLGSRIDSLDSLLNTLDQFQNATSTEPISGTEDNEFIDVAP